MFYFLMLRFSSSFSIVGVWVGFIMSSSSDADENANESESSSEKSPSPYQEAELSNIEQSENET